MESWKGSIFSIYSNQEADWQGAGYGPLLETPSVSAAACCPPACRAPPATGVPGCGKGVVVLSTCSGTRCQQ